jgi:translation initiation factor IF-2
VASDEGVKPQTIEAYETIKESKIPFVIALNKIDKPNADPERVKGQLAEKQILVEGYGGKIPTVKVSAKTGEGINDLLDMILLLAEMENLQANPEENASGFVIESKLSPQRGVAATLLIQNGTMKKGMFVISGKAIAPVRIFEDFLGNSLEEASFSSPIKIVGFDEMPEAGAEFKTFNTREEAEAARIKIEPLKIDRVQLLAGAIPIILKTDVTGSLEALEKEIMKKETENVKINILRKDTGNINEDDVKLASSAKNSIILGFNVKIDPEIKELAERLKVTTFLSPIIYEISEWLENETKEKSVKKEEIIGTAKILKTFSRIKNKQLVGGQVISGKIGEKEKFKIKRNGMEIGEGKIISLQKNKTPVKEAKEGDEFGIMIESKIELAKDDEIVVV